MNRNIGLPFKYLAHNQRHVGGYSSKYGKNTEPGGLLEVKELALCCRS